jgi:hypothetical protein
VSRSDDEIRALIDAATPGPWEMQPGGIILGPPRNRESLAAWVVQLVDLIHDADAEFIAAARDLVPALLERAQRAEARLAAVEAALLQGGQTPAIRAQQALFALAAEVWGQA